MSPSQKPQCSPTFSNHLECITSDNKFEYLKKFKKYDSFINKTKYFFKKLEERCKQGKCTFNYCTIFKFCWKLLQVGLSFPLTLDFSPKSRQKKRDYLKSLENSNKMGRKERNARKKNFEDLMIENQNIRNWKLSKAD